MILLIDAGNTLVKWRAVGHADNTVHDEGAFAHEAVDDLIALFARHTGGEARAIRRIVGVNVAGPALAARIDAHAATVSLAPEWITASAALCGVRNRYDDPARLGADRWAALIGARRLHSHACLVVTSGTATTIDLLDGGGDFLGGLILPGVDLMRRALSTHTAQLPLAEGCFAATPRNTADAIYSGCLQAQAGAVERMFTRIAGMPHACCLLGGGGAGHFADLLTIPARRVDNLVLHGLAAIAHTPSLS